MARRSSSRNASEDLVKLALVEVGQGRHPATGVLAINLDQAGNEEFLLLIGLCLPVIWFANGDQKTSVPSPLAKVGRDVGPCVGLYGGEVIEVPCLSNRKSAIDVLFCLVYSYTTRLPNGDDNDSRLF